MRRLFGIAGVFIALEGVAALGAGHLTLETCIKAADAGRVCLQSDGGFDGVMSSCEIQNQGSTTLWCALANPVDAVPLHCRSIPAGGAWSLDTSGATAIWCVPATVDQQTSLDGGASGTADGGPAGCTITTILH